MTPPTEARVRTLEAERDQLQQWVNDLQSRMYVNCVYCGHRYGPDPGTPVAMAEVLKAHIQQCPKHPLSEALAALASQGRQLQVLTDGIRSIALSWEQDYPGALGVLAGKELRELLARAEQAAQREPEPEPE